MLFKAKVSVVIPFYNVEPYIRECLDSVVGQTLKDIEIICVDDCGQDGSLAICEEFAKRDSRVKIIKHKQNQGQGQARNTGIDAAVGKYLWFIDSDDLFASNDVLESFYKCAELNNANVVFGKHKKMFVYDAGNKTYQDAKSFLQDAIDRGDIIKDENCIIYFTKYSYIDCFKRLSQIDEGVSVCTKLFKTSAIKDINLKFLSNVFYEDHDFYWKFFTNYRDICLLDKDTIFYRYRVGSTVNSLLTEKYLNSAVIVVSSIYENLVANNLLEEFKKEFVGCIALFRIFLSSNPKYQDMFLAKLKENKSIKPFVKRDVYYLCSVQDFKKKPFKIIRRLILSVRFKKNKRTIVLFGLVLYNKNL